MRNKYGKLMKSRSLIGKLEVDEALHSLMCPIPLRFISDSVALSL